MKITFKELLKYDATDWLNREIMNSLGGNNPEVFKSGEKDQAYEVKLLINGHELEPKLLGRLIGNVVDYIEKEAKDYAKEELNKALERVHILQEVLDDAADKIKEEFNLPSENYED